MLITAARLIPYRLPLRRPWRSARGVLRVREGWLLVLETESGEQGIGECAPLPEMGTETAESASAWLDEMLVSLRGRTPGDLLEALPPTAPPAAGFGLETALLDLLSKGQGLPLHAWLTPGSTPGIRVNESIGALDEKTAARIDGAAARGYRLVKVKVGVRGVEEETRAIERLCRGLNPGTRLRLDANGAWSADQATLFVSSLDSRCVESLEEPLALPETDTLAALQARTDVSLALDESLPAFLENHSMDRLPVRRIVIKPSVLGGIMPSASLRREADRAGIESVVTSTLESNVGILAAAHLAAATDGDRPAVHGLATGKWFTRNTARPPGIHAGMLRLPGGPGLGLAAPR